MLKTIKKYIETRQLNKFGKVTPFDITKGPGSVSDDSLDKTSRSSSASDIRRMGLDLPRTPKSAK